jgi:hypothetical protein
LIVRFAKQEKGLALPLALGALLLAMLVIIPFVQFTSTTLVNSRQYQDIMLDQYANDAAVEHALWQLSYGTLAEQFASPGDNYTYTLPVAVNERQPLIDITANVTPTSGSITNTTIDNDSVATGLMGLGNIVHISGNVYAVVYWDINSDGWVSTFTVADDGTITPGAISTYEFGPVDGLQPNIIHVSGNVYAVAYRGLRSDGFVRTITIATDGTITQSVIDTLEFDTSNGWAPDVIHVSGDVFAIFYRGTGADGFVKTVEITTGGQITNTVIDTLEYNTSRALSPSALHIGGDIFAVAYSGPLSDGWLSTIEIAANGQITNSVVDTYEYDTTQGNHPSLVSVFGDVYAIAFQGALGDGFLVTLEIDASGTITKSLIDSLEFETVSCADPHLANVVSDTYGIVYEGPGNDGWLATVTIQINGNIFDQVFDTLEFDPAFGETPQILHVDGSVYIVMHDDQNNIGQVTTFEIESTTGSAYGGYVIISTVNGRTTRVSANVTGGSVIIQSWVIE